MNDAVDALMWTKTYIKNYGGDAEKIYLSGESAGGTIATATTAVNYDSMITDTSKKVDIKGLFILYPCLEQMYCYIGNDYHDKLHALNMDIK